ncbi:50S ribosomal protein L2 [Candidatus Dojkabacteria bacterium]|uniref:Large ribosomal subunit protein uL2 n=1 Tax=Candidatus Dojkabacteria bacterium TaxID=2099670 RepID=A0A955I4R3_9BACT|nr:50S ribosomal protein L2 [Candidatus Dojkabacteria bacterium]
MALKKFKPTTPTRRHTMLVDRSELSKAAPQKRLLASQKSTAGRNNSGRITTRHRGGGVKTKYRIVDFKRDKQQVAAIVETLEYDPNRSAFLALLKYVDGERRYILAPDGLKVGDQIVSGDKDVAIEIGNTMPLSQIPQGTMVHAVEMWPGKGAIIGRSAGGAVQVMGGDKGYVQLRMPSGEIRLVKEECYATIGNVSNPEHKNQKLGSAGRKRKKGFRPAVRGVAMSWQHPHGAGQGKSGRHGTGGPAKDRWGNKVGTRTRKHRSVTSKFIVRRRPSKHKFKKYKTVI